MFEIDISKNKRRKKRTKKKEQSDLYSHIYWSNDYRLCVTRVHRMVRYAAIGTKRGRLRDGRATWVGVETFIAGPYFYTLPLLLATLICVVRHNRPPSSMENLRECSPSFSSPSLQLVDLNRCQIKIAHRVTYFSAEFLDISRVGRIPLKYLFFNFVFTRSPFLPKFLLMLLQMPGISIFRKIIIEKHRYLDRIELDSNLLYF